MKTHILAAALITIALSSAHVGGQDAETVADVLGSPGLDLSRPADRQRAVEKIAAIEKQRRAKSRARATQLGLPLRSELPNGRIQEINDFTSEGQPIYFTTHNVNAAISTGANLLRPAPYNLSGSGVTVGVWDGGAARPTHQEFGSRVTVMDGAAAADHATHVAGTIGATGMSANARGMANAATVHSYEWTSDITEMTVRAATAPGTPANGIYLSNHSYGYVAGWNYTGGAGTPARTWEWNGNGTTSDGYEYDFGRYNTYAREIDSLVFNAPYYLPFQSAGNERGDAPAAGAAVALSPGSSTVVNYDPALHPSADSGYRGGFDTIGFRGLAKNIITVGSVSDAVSGGIRATANANVSSFSSWGPTDDGRIKPDVVANGEALYSSFSASNTTYGTMSGTSMATPNACGSAALLVQHYGSLFPGGAMRASTLKGLLIHTANDRGNAGPDYKYGWGLVNVKSAADLLSDHQAYPDKKRLTENQLTTSTTTRTVSFVWDGTSPIVATLCWTDPAGKTTTTTESRTPRLVNNLNLKIIAPGGAEYLPYTMPFVGTWTQASMDLPATTGINNTDNVEQVRIATPPAAGTYQAIVSYSGTLTNAQQNYSLILSGSSSPTTVTINQAAGQADPTSSSPVNFTVVFSEAVTGFTASDVALSGTVGGTLSATVTGSGTTYNVAVTGMNGTGTITASIPANVITDSTGSGNTASTSTDNTITRIQGIPVVTTWPTANSITYGQPLASSTLTGGSASTPGTFAFTHPAIVPPPGTSSQSVTFTPTDTVNYLTTTGTVNVTATAPEISVENPAGNPLADALSVVDCGPANPGTPTTPLTFTIRNTGNSNLTGLALTKDGPEAADFTLGAPAVSTLTPGASTTFTVAFNPSAPGNRSATLHLASNDADENPFDLTLTGYGRSPIEVWRFNEFGTDENTGPAADTANNDHDRMQNLMEYALGTDPQSAGPMPFVSAETGTQVSITYPRNLAATDVVITFEKSTDLGITDPWSPATVVETPVGAPVNGIQSTQATHTPPPGQARYFLRMKVSPAP